MKTSIKVHAASSSRKEMSRVERIYGKEVAEMWVVDAYIGAKRGAGRPDYLDLDEGGRKALSCPKRVNKEEVTQMRMSI